MKCKIIKFVCCLVVPVGCSVTADPSTWVIDTAEQWQSATAESEGLNFDKGFATPEEEQASFKSTLQRFSKKRSVKNISLTQSPVWENWNKVDNIGPKNLNDAPVLLSLGPDNYWIFGRYAGRAPKDFVREDAALEGFDIPLKTTPFPNQFDAPGGLQARLNGYNAWQSKDMVNWVHHGAITEKFSCWVTTAEYVDGKAYFYYDYPNDQDPHLYIDDNLFDGKPGENKGMVFKDPSHGSDCTFIRDLEGNFHVIYEDWSPINASKRSWDSPLAGHAVSKDSIHDFKILAPAVDNRTKPTGVMKEYKHPHWLQHPDWDTNMGKYEVHEPEQEAYGDWASISIGGQYYLFGDFDPAGGHQMSVGWFTTDSLDKPFTWCGHIGKGHPDPDVMFAEGQFYLATQQKTDFVSPGPWVEKVEIRVGVDTSNDGEIDQWSDWQEVKESYDYIEGFSKQVKRIPAALDLSSLPEGFGFAFELRLEDGTENKSKPIIDAVSLSFHE